jgi:hypothetical protein
MLVSVNKNTVAKRPINYAALASGTVSHVWSDEEPKLVKRKVHVHAKSEKGKAAKQTDA